MTNQMVREAFVSRVLYRGDDAGADRVHSNKRTRHRFTKAFDHKWMVAEPGGLFEGPSGKHSSRVGELKIGACSVSRGTL